jgi:hypothetical protein
MGNRPSSSVSKKLLKSLRRQRRIPRRVLDVAMPKVGLDCARVVTVIGELVAAGMTEHVGVRLDTQVGIGASPLHHAGEARRR